MEEKGGLGEYGREREMEKTANNIIRRIRNKGELYGGKDIWK